MSRPDESSLKSDYCAGVLSIQKVAVKHGIAKSTLIDMAKKNQWTREKNPTKKSDQNENGRTDGREKKYLKNSDEKNPGNFPSDNRYSDSDYTFNPDDFGISEQQGVFAEYVAAGKSLAEAYRLAGYQGEGNTIYVNASRLLRNAKVYRAIRWLRDKRQRRLALTEDEIIHQLSAIASADPNEISHIRRVNCRYCWEKTINISGVIWMSTTLRARRHLMARCLNMAGSAFLILLSLILNVHAVAERAYPISISPTLP
ncbi:hypothetical protein EAP58_27010 [Salmonella enterica]|nr:hypothetical protein [Salmonella enterica]